MTMQWSSQLTRFTILMRQNIRAATKTNDSTKVAVVTAKTDGPRSGTPPLEVALSMSESERPKAQRKRKAHSGVGRVVVRFERMGGYNGGIPR